MQTQLFLVGTIAGVKVSEFKGEITKKWQFMIDDGETIAMIEVKRGEGDFNEYERGEQVRIPVAVSTMNNSNQVFYKTLPHEKKTEGVKK